MAINFWRTSILVFGLVLGAVLNISFVSAQEVYFGEDLTPSGSVPAGGEAETARQEFLHALTAGVSTENFERFTDNRGGPLELNFVGGLGRINAILSGSGQIGLGPSIGRFATSGEKYWENTGDYSIEFSTPIAAFGFYGTDIGDFDGNITLRTENGSIKNYVVPNTRNGPSGSLLFYGIVDRTSPFQSIQFGNTAPGVDVFGFDDLTVGDVSQVQPAPNTLPDFSLPLRGAPIVFNTEPGGAHKDPSDFYNPNHSKAKAYYSIDFDAKKDVEVVAAASGRVVASEVQTIEGEKQHVVILYHGDGYFSEYREMSTRSELELYSMVEEGQKLGTLNENNLSDLLDENGNREKGDHLHFQVKHNPEPGVAEVSINDTRFDDPNAADTLPQEFLNGFRVKGLSVFDETADTLGKIRVDGKLFSDFVLKRDSNLPVVEKTTGKPISEVNGEPIVGDGSDPNTPRQTHVSEIPYDIQLNGPAKVGRNATVQSNHTLSIGDELDSTLNVENGGSVGANHIEIGGGFSGTETIANGKLLIRESGEVTTGSLGIGSFAPGRSDEGELIVEGQNSFLHISAEREGKPFGSSVGTAIGFFGDGSLIVRDSGTVRNETVTAIGGHPSGSGSYSASSGRVSVSGEGSVWDSSENVYIGFGGPGVFVFRDGADVSARRWLVGPQGVLVGDNATIGGTEIVMEGGVFRPGASPGNAVIDANLVFESGLIELEVENGVSDKILVSGLVSIGADALFDLFFDVLPESASIADYFEGANLQFDPGFLYSNIDVFTRNESEVGNFLNVRFGERQASIAAMLAPLAPVPLPAAFPLLLTALSVLGLLGWCRRK